MLPKTDKKIFNDNINHNSLLKMFFKSLYGKSMGKILLDPRPLKKCTVAIVQYMKYTHVNFTISINGISMLERVEMTEN